MSRTPLHAMLQRAARIARLSLHAREPLDELVPRVREARVDLTRRRLLQATGAGLALAGSRSLPLPRAMDGDAVAIVGAGIAGLSAAWRLRQQGVPVALYEAQNRIGGRMLSLRGRFADGQVVELGGELIDSGHVHMRAMARELGIALDDLQAGEDARDAWYFDGALRDEAEIVRAFVPVAAALERDLALLGDGDLDWRDANPAFRALDALSITQWLDRSGVHGWLRRLLEVAYTTEMGLEADQQSALNLVTFLGSGADAFKVFGESDERFHVHAGNDAIPQALGQKLSDALHVGEVLEAVRREGDVHVLSFRRDGASHEVRARQAILALPLTLLREVRLDLEMPAAQRRAIDTLAYGTNAKLMIGFDARPWRARGYNGASMSDLAYQTSWETSRGQAGRAGILTNFTGGRHGVDLGAGTPELQAQAAVRDLERVFPGVAAARGGATQARMHWPSHPWARGSYLCYRPGEWSTLRGAQAQPVGGLHFAGEHCAMDTQGFMEGGCESGTAAARAVLAQRRVRWSLPDPVAQQRAASLPRAA